MSHRVTNPNPKLRNQLKIKCVWLPDIHNTSAVPWSIDLVVWYCASLQVSLNIWRKKSEQKLEKMGGGGILEAEASVKNVKIGIYSQICEHMLFKKMQPHQPQEQSLQCEVQRPSCVRITSYHEWLPSPLWVFIMVQCCKITGFPQCFLLFVRLCHGNLEPVHVGDSGLSCKAPHSGIHDVSGSCAKAFLRHFSDSSTQEPHCGNEEITPEERENKEKKEKKSSCTYI